MRTGITALLVGILFGAGLTLSGMTNPQKVIAFLDLFGAWDPSLAFVMIGAIAVHFAAYRIIKHRTSPLLADSFAIPENKSIDRSLLTGATIFGVGWGLGGICPGPAITALVGLDPTMYGFVAAMAAGMLVQERMSRPKKPGSSLDLQRRFCSNVDPKGAANLLKADPSLRLIDVRTPEEFQQIHAAGAINLPLSELSPEYVRRAGVYPNHKVLMICQSGARSAKACALLKDAGYDAVINVEGGTLAWTSSELPVFQPNTLEEEVR